jgi:pimeloyl-ACP methyl ester carboxylesterase
VIDNGGDEEALDAAVAELWPRLLEVAARPALTRRAASHGPPGAPCYLGRNPKTQRPGRAVGGATMDRGTGRSTFLLVVALAAHLRGGLIATLVQSDFGAVRVTEVRFAVDDGRMVHGKLFVPRNASASAPAPGVVAIHGYINSHETQSPYAIELARRGYVVLAIDQPGHGYSDPPAFAGGFGGIDALGYLRSLPFVDTDQIVLSGHSMGGWASLIAAAVIPDGYTSIVISGSSTGTFGAPDGTPEYPRNLGLVWTQYDEFSQLMWLTPTAPEARAARRCARCSAPTRPSRSAGCTAASRTAPPACSTARPSPTRAPTSPPPAWRR